MKNKSLIILCGLLASLFIGCEDLKFGDNFLEKPNSDDVSIDTVFSSKKYADQALNQFYKSCGILCLPERMPSGGAYFGWIY